MKADQKFDVRIVEHEVVKLPYAKLKPCGLAQEDLRNYGLHNEDDEAGLETEI